MPATVKMTQPLDKMGQITEANGIDMANRRFPAVKILTLLKILSIMSLLISTGVLIADEKLEEPPPPPEILEEEKHLPEPEVTIIKRKDMVIEEYRVNGRLRYAKITPSSGPAYYMVDTDGDGELDTKNTNLRNPPIQQWILYKW